MASFNGAWSDFVNSWECPINISTDFHSQERSYKFIISNTAGQFYDAWSDFVNSWEFSIYINNDFNLLGAEFIQFDNL